MFHTYDRHRKGMGEILNLDNFLGASKELNEEAAEATEVRKTLILAVPGLLLCAVLPGVLFASAAQTLLILTLVGSVLLLAGLAYMKKTHPLFLAAYSLAVVLTVLNALRFGVSILAGDGAIGQDLLAIFGGIAAFTGFGAMLCLGLGVRHALDDVWLPTVLLPVLYGVLLCLSALEYSPLVLGIKVVLGLAVALLLFRASKLAKAE